ncbi:MAG: hypothetical protein HY720_20165 [Planctomycetes bacterium]|nr:hypothetical protein [Planctomycetota bacterium]
MKRRKREHQEPADPLDFDFSELDFYREYWLALSPRERMRRSWAMRSRLPDPEAVHDAKLFPRP